MCGARPRRSDGSRGRRIAGIGVDDAGSTSTE